MDLQDSIKYELYREQELTRIIVVNPSDRNIDRLKILGQQLAHENYNKTIAFVCVFDDKKAADMIFDITSDWSKEQEEFYFNHFIASYNRNVYTKLNRFFIHLPESEGGEYEMKFHIYL